MKKIAIAASSVALAAMPVVGVFAATTDVRQSTDTLNVTVNDTCNITSTYATTGADGSWGTEQDDTAHVDPVYQTKKNTWTVSMDNSASKTSPAHTIAIFCNNTKGWDLNAQNAANLSTGTGGDTIAYNTSAAANTEGYYVSVAASSSTDSQASISTDNVHNGKFDGSSNSAVSIYSKAPVTTGDNQHTGSTSTASIDVAYTVGTDATTEAGTYTGTVVYTLVPKTN